MVSAIDLAKRALVILLKSLAMSYGLELGLARDSPDNAIRNAYRKVSRKVHPDRGGDAEQQKALNRARDACRRFARRVCAAAQPSAAERRLTVTAPGARRRLGRTIAWPI